MRFRKVLLGPAILILVSGIFLFAMTIVRETHTSSRSGSFSGGIPGGGFGYGGATLPLNDSYQSIVGTSGIADLIILTTPWKDFNGWICNQPQVYQLLPGGISDCPSFGGGSWFNITILESYLQTHKSQIAYSQTIVDQNITLSSIAYHVDRPTDVTIVLAHFGSSPTREFYQTTVTNQILSYPLLGYTENPRTIFTLPNISMGLVAAGAASLAILSVAQHRLHPSRKPEAYYGGATGKCPGCGGENLFFAERCLHCGRTLHETPPMMQARTS